MFFFGDKSVLTANPHRLHRSIKAHIITFCTAQLRSPSFTAEFAYAMDTQTFRWLKMYLNAADCSQMDDTLVSFDTLLSFVLIDNFLQPLPASIAWISNKRQRTELTDDSESGRGKKCKKQETRLADNTQMDPDWKLHPSGKWNADQTTTD